MDDPRELARAGFFERLDNNPHLAIIQIINRFTESLPTGYKSPTGDLDLLLLWAAAVNAFIVRHNLEITPFRPTGSKEKDAQTVLHFLRNTERLAEQQIKKRTAAQAFDDMHAEFQKLFEGSAPGGMLSSDQRQELQSRINDLRDMIAGAGELPDDLRTRLLRRLEDLQREMHKPVTNLDAVFGVLVQVGLGVKRHANALYVTAINLAYVAMTLSSVQHGLPPPTPPGTWELPGPSDNERPD